MKPNEPILYVLRSSNRVDTSTTQTNKYSIYVPKPNAMTNKFLLKFIGINMGYLAATTTSSRSVEIRINFPSLSYDSTTGGSSSVIGYAYYDNTNRSWFSYVNQEKIITLQDGVYDVGFYTESGALLQDNDTNVLPAHSINFTLTPIID